MGDSLRSDAAGRWVRLHQEDACQSLAVSPIRKYENEGGPGAPDIAALILRESDSPGHDLGAFIDALALNWVLGGTDAHAKNYAFLLSPGSVRLAPLYDLISILPYPGQVHYKEAKLAMRIDREYHVWKIRRRHWEGLAMRSELDPEAGSPNWWPRYPRPHSVPRPRCGTRASLTPSSIALRPPSATTRSAACE